MERGEELKYSKGYGLEKKNLLVGGPSYPLPLLFSLKPFLAQYATMQYGPPSAHSQEGGQGFIERRGVIFSPPPPPPLLAAKERVEQ